MNRETRDKFASRTSKVLTTGNSCWETAPKIFEKLNEDFGPFDIDLTGDSRRALCPRWFGPDSEISTDALTANWSMHAKNGYSNAPYYGPFVAAMLALAREQMTLGFTSTFLLPLRVTRAFRKYVLRGATQLLLPDKRLVFFEDGVPRCSQDKKRPGVWHADTAMFDSMIVRYVPGTRIDAEPRIREWLVPKHVTADDIDRYKQMQPLYELGRLQDTNG